MYKEKLDIQHLIFSLYCIYIEKRIVISRNKQKTKESEEISFEIFKTSSKLLGKIHNKINKID